jgi:hypothetical protein
VVGLFFFGELLAPDELLINLLRTPPVDLVAGLGGGQPEPENAERDEGRSTNSAWSFSCGGLTCILLMAKAESNSQQLSQLIPSVEGN